jgi:hypothetical protein
MRRPLSLLAPLAAASLLACSATTTDDAAGGSGAITSNDARILDFKFKGEVIGSDTSTARTAIVSQLMYAQGIFTTAGHGNGHVGNVVLSNVTEKAEGDKKRIAYEASLPVAWPKGVDTPKSYDLPLPLDATRFDDFNAKYDGKCGRNEYGRDTFWHDWNPKASGCAIDDADVSRGTATIATHPKETTSKFPEYAEIWKDDRLDVVAIFGIITSNTPSDMGYGEARDFLDTSKGLLDEAKVVENRASDSILKDTTLTGKVTFGGKARDVKVDVIVVEELQSVGSDFDARYDALSEKADLILYNGHAGLGKNVNALGRKGKITAGKYQLMLLNGCQTFAYIDTTIFDRRTAANGADRDPNGTRFLDVVGNALPGFAHNLASMSNKIFAAAVGADKPQHYNQLLDGMPESHIVVVFGEDDNQFSP